MSRPTRSLPQSDGLSSNRVVLGEASAFGSACFCLVPASRLGVLLALGASC